MMYQHSQFNTGDEGFKHEAEAKARGFNLISSPNWKHLGSAVANVVETTCDANLLHFDIICFRSVLFITIITCTISLYTYIYHVSTYACLFIVYCFVA